MNVAITLIAALLAGTGFVLQQHAAEQAPQSYFLRLRLITTLLLRPRWLAGVAVMAAGQLLSAWAIGHVPLSLAEPLLTSSLIFALALAVPLSGQRLRTAEVLGAVLLSAGVAALSVARTAGAPAESFGSFAAWPAAAGIGAVAAGFLVAGLHRTGPQRATLTGIAAGLVFGDVIHVSPGMLALQGAGLAAMVLGVILVARAPVLSGLGRAAGVPSAEPRRALGPRVSG
jgi:drug/metabolite transporter (DMT)-like permease